MDKRSSLDEKKADAGLPHWIYVHELIELLSKVDANVAVSCNTVGNLMLEDDKGYIGYIDLLWNKIYYTTEKGRRLTYER